MADQQRRIQAVISFLEGDAAIWATLISENINKVTAQMVGVTLMYANWEEFKKAFKACFKTADDVVDAKEALKKPLARKKHSCPVHCNLQAAFQSHRVF